MPIVRNINYGYFTILFFMVSESNSFVRLMRQFKNFNTEQLNN